MNNHDTAGAELIAEERKRQLERWSSGHDDEHSDGEMAIVAALYASPIPLLARREMGDGEVAFVDPWPWWNTEEIARYNDGATRKVKAWDKRKRHSRLRNLIVAGALIAAEIDRLQRVKR